MDVHSTALLSPVPAAGARPALRHVRRPALSVVIVNYQRWDDTGRVVRQLRAEPALRRGDAEIVIVDNHSPYHPLVPRLRRTDGVSLRRWRSNRGFSRAVNEGCRLSRGDWLLLLNPDTTVSPGFIDQVLHQAEERVASDPSTGIVGFRLEDPDGSHQLSTGRLPGLFGSIARLSLPRRRRKYTLPATSGPVKVDWVTGCCLLIRRECWDDLGGLDPDFFLYYEDVDLCRRAAAHDWSVWYDPAVTVTHHRPLHLRQVPAHLRLLTRHALLTYAHKHWPAWQTRLLGGLIKVESAIRRLGAWWKGDAEVHDAFTALECIAEDVPAGRVALARRRLLRVIRHQEQHRGPGSLEARRTDWHATVDCHPQPQPC